MKIPPAATAVTVGMITSRNSRDRTRQFFSARREAGRGADSAPGCWRPSRTGEDPLGAELSGAAAPATGGLASCVTCLIAGRGIPRIFLALDSAVLGPLTMRPTGVQRHAGAATEPTRDAPPGRRFCVHSVTS